MTALAIAQQAFYDRLSEDTELAAANVTVFYDEAPPNFKGPHIVIADSTEVPGNTIGRRGWDGTETVHVWVPGSSGKLARDIAALVTNALEGEPPEGLFRCRAEFSAALSEPGWRHVLTRFRLWTRGA